MSYLKKFLDLPGLGPILIFLGLLIMLVASLTTKNSPKKSGYSLEWKTNPALISKTYKKGDYIIKCERSLVNINGQPDNNPHDFGYYCTYQNEKTKEAGIPLALFDADL